MMNLEQRELKQLKQENAELRANLHNLLGAMNLLRDDLLSRAEIDYGGRSVVNCGASAWRVFCDAIDETPAQSLQQIKRDAVLEVRDRMIFPSMLRKMWSGNDVQVWLNHKFEEHANNLVKDGE